MRVIGDRHCHRIDVFLLFLKHVAPILIEPGIWMGLAGLFSLFLISVTNGDDFFRTAMMDIAAAFATRSDAANSQLFAAAGNARTRFTDGREGGGTRRRECRVVKKSAAC